MAEVKTSIENLLSAEVKKRYGLDVAVKLAVTEADFGDYSSNISMQISKRINANSRQIAEELKTALEQSELWGNTLAKVDVAGPGFLNLWLSNEALNEITTEVITPSLAGKMVVAEYSDPNPFKILHAGHLYTSVVGESIARLLEAAGASVHRVNFGGDVGLHAARMLWAINQALNGEYEKLDDLSETELNQLVTVSYIKGTAADENNETAKAEIKSLNKQIYGFFEQQDHETNLAKIYWRIRQFYYDVYFKQFYESIGTKFDKYYPESETAPLGLKTVREQLEKGVYKSSDGAVVFEGEPYGLHTRVFVNSEGLPTYEAKDVGLIFKKYEDYKFDISVVITGNDIVEYMKVVLKSIEQYAPELVKATRHLTHGMVKLSGGVKMSSRLGNILRAQDVLKAAEAANRTATGKDENNVVLGAVKYAFLKQRMGGDIIYDPEESVSLEGNSGPYLQYAHARAKSILRKSDYQSGSLVIKDKLEPAERLLLRKISHFKEVVERAIEELAPHYICTYLYELAQEFNRFYEHNRVIGDERQTIRLDLTALYADTLKRGLDLLGIIAPETM